MKRMVSASGKNGRIYYGFEVANFGYDDRDDATLDKAEALLTKAGCTYDYDGWGRLVVTETGKSILESNPIINKFIDYRKIYPSVLGIDEYADLI